MNKSLLHLWGKTEAIGAKTETHPLLFHMLDAGNVALVLWTSALPPKTQEGIAGELALDVAAAGRLIAFWAALHDLGKAGPAFQAKHPPSLDLLSKIGLGFPSKQFFSGKPHGLVTGWALCEELDQSALTPDALEALAMALSGHHGDWPDASTFADEAKGSNLGDAAWSQARKDLIAVIRQVFSPPLHFTFPGDVLPRNTFLAVLSGLVVVSDWLASMKTPFHAQGVQLTWEEYQPISRQRAEEAVRAQGWNCWQDAAANAPLSFQEAFPQLGNPRAIQTAVLAAACEAALPALALVEAPTGIGKTEIALLLADDWLRRGGGRGLYVAMPTQATSNQMYNRAKGFLLRRYPAGLVNLQLAHGHAALMDSFADTILNSVDENREEGVAALSWFLPRKRTLLAPYGVGTVDQVFLSILQTRHFFVRLFGLFGKTVIFDEVHAYDAYQSELFCRLLAWLRALNVSVILLSATLPKEIRKKFIAAYGGAETESLEDGYPRLTLVSGGEACAQGLPPGESAPVALDHLGHDAEAVVAYLREKLAGGGCAAVICNTVARAQQIYLAVRAAQLAPGQTHLFHARFPFHNRSQTEQLVVNTFGRVEGTRPARAIVVATQVIEQSLDLDFDLMISELAPIDLLIQRAGRLHRHKRSTPRPALLAEPRLALMETQQTPAGDPDFGPDRYVYRRYHLLRTQALLAGRDVLWLPRQTPELIEAVYGDQPLPLDARPLALLADARAEMEQKIAASAINAKRRIVLPPQRDDFLTRKIEALEEEDPAVHSDFQALTREAPPGVSLVCLHRLPDGQTALQPGDTSTQIDLGRPPTHEQVTQLLGASLQVQRPEVVRYFAGQPHFAPWKDIPALRYHHPVVFQNGQAPLPGLAFAIRLDPELGLSFQKEDA